MHPIPRLASRLPLPGVATLLRPLKLRNMAWLDAKYGGPNFNELDPDNAPPTQHEVNLQTLGIVENDAMCTFARMTLALPHVVRNTSALHLSSTNGCCEFQQTNPKMFVQLLPQMENLKTLQLSVGEVFRDESHLLGLYRLFPRTLTTLRLRGPAMLTQSDHWKEWEEAFASRTFLPDLKRLSIQMDLCYKDRESGSASWPLKERTELPEEIRLAANAACERLGALARSRGVNVEEMEDWETPGVSSDSRGKQQDSGGRCSTAGQVVLTLLMLSLLTRCC